MISLIVDSARPDEIPATRARQIGLMTILLEMQRTGIETTVTIVVAVIGKGSATRLTIGHVFQDQVNGHPIRYRHDRRINRNGFAGDRFGGWCLRPAASG